MAEPRRLVWQHEKGAIRVNIRLLHPCVVSSDSGATLTVSRDRTVPSEDDAHVVARLSNGDMDAAGELYDRYASQVFRLAWRSAERRRSPKKSCRMSLRRRGEQLDPESSRGIRLAGCWRSPERVRSTVSARGRRGRTTMAEPYAAALQAPGMTPVDQVLSAEQATRIQQALVALPEGQRRALDWHITRDSHNQRSRRAWPSRSGR